MKEAFNRHKTPSLELTMRQRVDRDYKLSYKYNVEPCAWAACLDQLLSSTQSVLMMCKMILKDVSNLGACIYAVTLVAAILCNWGQTGLNTRPPFSKQFLLSIASCIFVKLKISCADNLPHSHPANWNTAIGTVIGRNTSVLVLFRVGP